MNFLPCRVILAHVFIFDRLMISAIARFIPAPSSCGINTVSRIIVDIGIGRKCLWLFWEACKWIDGRELALIGTIPPCPEIHQPRRSILQLAGEAEGRHAAALYRAPWVVVHDTQRRRSCVEGAAHAAERVLGVPGGRAAVQRSQAVQAVDVVGSGRSADFALEDLAQRGGEILGIQRSDAAGDLLDQRAIAVVGVVRRGAAFVPSLIRLPAASYVQPTTWLAAS